MCFPIFGQIPGFSTFPSKNLPVSTFFSIFSKRRGKIPFSGLIYLDWFLKSKHSKRERLKCNSDTLSIKNLRFVDRILTKN